MALADDSGSLVTEPKPHVIAGRYEVRGLVGVGGMGAVYKVYDRALDEIVALKMIRPEMSHSAEMLERLRREVKLARRVTHPNVARTFDFGTAGGEHFLTMELVAGESLAMKLARHGALDLGAVVKLLGPICDGLAAAHAAGVVHRDLKPDNVLVGDDGRVVIMDFGVARLAAQSPNDTAVPVGTPAYMAPEQVEGGDVDFRADVYQLGVMLFELLTGRLPFEASTPYAVAAMRLMHPPPDPRVHVPTLPDSVALLVRRCMARNPEDRPASALAVSTRFSEFTLPHGSIPPPSRPPAFVASPRSYGKTVGVVPFRNGGSSEDAYLVDGLTDDLVDALSMTPGLRVRARGAVMQMQTGDVPRDPRELGRALAVQVVVCGTVRSDGDRIRVSARALSVDDGFQLWAQRFEGPRTDVLRIADDAAQAIAIALTVEKPTRPIVSNPQAVDLYLRGRHEFLKYWAASNDRAIKLLAEANAIAPDDPLIMSAYAAALTRQFGVAEVEGRVELARKVARRAVELAPETADAHVALAATLLHDADAVGAARELTRALCGIAPAHPDALELKTRMAAEAGALRTSIEFARRCIQVEPRMQALRYNVIARSYALLGEWDEVELDCATPPPDLELASVYWLMLARLTLWRRDAKRAARIAESVRAQPAFGSRGIVLAACVFMSTRTLPSDEVDFIEARAAAPHATSRIRCFWHQIGAEIFMYFGDASRALEHLEQASNLGLFDVAWVERCPLFEPLRDHPRFETLRARISARAGEVRGALEMRGRA
jgi:serine/threonine-protein kinase